MQEEHMPPAVALEAKVSIGLIKIVRLKNGFNVVNMAMKMMSKRKWKMSLMKMENVKLLPRPQQSPPGRKMAQSRKLWPRVTKVWLVKVNYDLTRPLPPSRNFPTQARMSNDSRSTIFRKRPDGMSPIVPISPRSWNKRARASRRRERSLPMDDYLDRERPSYIFSL